MAVVTFSYIDMNAVVVRSKNGKEWFLGTNEFVDKLVKTVRDADPVAKGVSEKEIRDRVVVAMFANPMALIRVAQLTFDDPNITQWNTSAVDRHEEVDLGPLIGKKVLVGQGDRIGIVVDEKLVIDEDGNKDTEITIEYTNGKKHLIRGTYDWKLQVGDEWLRPHEIADRKREEESVGKAAGRLAKTSKGNVNVKRHSRRRWY